MEMVSKFTETLQELLVHKNYGEASEDAFLTEILGLMDKFPNFVFGENLNLSMKQLFLDKYDIREIGAETEELFMHYWREHTQRLLIKYVPKIKMWIDNFKDLFKFTVKLDLDWDEKYSNGSQNTYYLNPITANTGVQKTVVVDEEHKTTTTTFSGGNLKTQDVDTNDNNGQKSRKISRDVLQSVWGKTRPMILESIMELKDIYNECLDEYEIIFMGVF